VRTVRAARAVPMLKLNPPKKISAARRLDRRSV
jgi:hypothetical protein